MIACPATARRPGRRFRASMNLRKRPPIPATPCFWAKRVRGLRLPLESRPPACQPILPCRADPGSDGRPPRPSQSRVFGGLAGAGHAASRSRPLPGGRLLFPPGRTAMNLSPAVSLPPRLVGLLAPPVPRCVADHLPGDNRLICNWLQRTAVARSAGLQPPDCRMNDARRPVPCPNPRRSGGRRSRSSSGEALWRTGVRRAPNPYTLPPVELR